MTAIEFMEKQLRKCQLNFSRECERDPASEAACNLRRKCEYYAEAIEALREAGKLVRCKDCVCFVAETGSCKQHCAVCGVEVVEDDFCSYGERRENNEKMADK